jgi:hypothetical protein
LLPKHLLMTFMRHSHSIVDNFNQKQSFFHLYCLHWKSHSVLTFMCIFKTIIIMWKILFTLTLLLLAPFTLEAQSLSREDYIELYKDVAISEMKRTGLPASIKLAQGMLESGNGNSRLAVKANNHFGIKCHNGWKGKKIYHDDDEKDECFRVYNSADESYRDHSDFLKGSARYASLFTIRAGDYKSWASGLQKSGYATNPNYSKLLIKLIEENELYRFDKISEDKLAKAKTKDGYATSRIIYKRNRVNFILAEEGDTQESLRRELGLLPYQIRKYNEFEDTYEITAGEVIYLQPKRNSAARGDNEHILKEGETMHDVSQLYAVKIEKLYEKNLLSPESKLEIGDKLSLRKKLKGGKSEKLPRIKKTNDKIESEREKIEFEFE